MNIIGIIFLVGFSLVVGRIIYYRIYIRPEKLKYENQLVAIYPDIVSCDNILKENFIFEINNYETTNDTVGKIEKKVKELPFPIPSTPNTDESGENIINKLTTLIDKNSLAFVGTEQFILSIFPFEQIGNFTIYALGSIATHSYQALMENLGSIKTSFIEGIENLQNKEMLIQGLKNIGAHYFHNENSALYLRMLVNKFAENKLSAVGSVLQHSAVDFAHPIFNIGEHGQGMKLSWINHSSDAMSEIKNFDFDFDIDPSGHFPFVTLIMSGSREIKLLQNDKTSMENSLKNLVLDLAGTGLGALGGAKAGAALGGVIGSIIPGVGNVAGAAIGGLLGAIGGAIGGRAVTNNIKRQALDDAVVSYHLEFNQMLTDTKNCAKQSVEQVRSFAICKQNDFLDNLPAAPRFDNSKSEIVVLTQKLVKSLKTDLHKYNQCFTNLKNSKFASKSKYRKIINNIDSQLDRINSQIPSEYETNNNPIQSLHKIINIQFLRDKNFHSELSVSFQELKELIQNHRAIMIVWGMNANTLYKQAIFDIGSELNAQAENYNNKCIGWKQILNQKEKLVQIEREKLGV